MFYASILAFIITGCCTCIFGMDPAPIQDNHMITWKIILQHGVKWFDYRHIKSLVVSTTHDTLLRDTAEYRKTYLKKQLNLKSNNLTWHKHGAMCGWAIFESGGLYLKRFYLHQYGYDYQPLTLYFGKSEIPLPHKPKPYFNNRGAFCLYIYSTNYFNGKSGTIIKQMWDSSQQPVDLGLRSENCIAHIGGKEVTLKMFLEFPLLLKAFLKSRIVYKKKDNWWETCCSTIKIYDLEGVTIPKDYTKHQHYFSTVSYPSFNHLPKEVRKPIVNRYKTQKQKK